MSDLIIVVGDQSSNVASAASHSVGHTTAAFLHHPLLPPAIDAGQAYYWSMAWQRDQGHSRIEHASGHAITFDTADDAIGWLLSSG